MATRSILLVLALVATACTSAPPTTTPTADPTPLPSPTVPGEGFYLRAWVTQALPPHASFNGTPMLTIADGTLLDGNVAVPAVFPSPLMILPTARWISDAGSVAILDQAARLGLLGPESDFSGEAMPGARTGHVVLILDGDRRELAGNPDLVMHCLTDPCEPAPGSPEAFAAFWQALSDVSVWLEGELGAQMPYTPERLAILLTAEMPQDGGPGMGLRPVDWPLGQPMADSGTAFPGLDGDRCVTIEGEDLEALLPVLRTGSQLTVFVDAADNVRAPIVRLLVPGEESPCQS